MLTFFAVLCTRPVDSPSLKLSVFTIIDDMEIASADLQRLNIGDMKKIHNHINPPSIQ